VKIINKFLVAALLVIPLIANASEVETEPASVSVPVNVNDNPKLMYDFIPYIGAKVPKWITNVDKQVEKSNKIIKTFFYFESPNTYTFTVIDDILYSVEVRLGNYDFKNWTVENKYQKLGVASGIADSLQANGFTMSIDKTNTNIRYFQKGDVVVTLDNYKTQYKKDSNDSSILVSFTNNKVTEKIKKLEVDIVNQMAIEKQSEYRDLIGK
jgi:hypothetical protein